MNAVRPSLAFLALLAMFSGLNVATGDAQTETPHLRAAPAAPVETAAPSPPNAAPQDSQTAVAPTQSPVPLGLSDYAGTLDGSAAVHFTLIGGADGAVTGSYFAMSDLQDHAFAGKVIDAGSFSARVAGADGPTASPYLYLKVDKSHSTGDWLSGALYGAGDRNQHSVAIALKGADPAVTSEADRYAIAGASDAAAVEAAANIFWRAVVASQPAAAAQCVAYPLVFTENGRRTLVHTPAEFEAKFAAIFTPAFVAALKTTVPKAMAASERGISLGGGKVLFDAGGRAFAVDNDTVKMFAGKKFLSNAGWVRGASQTGRATGVGKTADGKTVDGKTGSGTNGGAGSTSTAAAGRRHSQRRSRRRHSPPAGGNG